MADLICEAAVNSGGSAFVAPNGTTTIDIDCGQPFVSPRNGAADTRQISVTLAVQALSGGVSPSVALITSRKEEDAAGNQTGVLTQVDAPAALTTVSATTRTIGPNQAQAANLSRYARVSVVVAGGPTVCQWAVTATVTR